MKPEKEGIFATLVLGLHSSALISLGKAANPLTRKVERDLEAAKHTIVVLEMLREKTRGNLKEDESRLVDGCIATLQMSYFEEVEADRSDGGKDPGS